MLRRHGMRWVRSAALVCASVAAQAQTNASGDPARGAELATACAACHGARGAAPLAGMPALAGQQREFLELQLILLREGLRDVPVMAGMLKAFSDPDLIDIAAYYSVEKPAVPTSQRDAQRHARGAALSLAMGCGSCHMSDYSGQRQVPRITGQREDYLAAALRAYRDNQRTGTDTSMNAVMYQASDADIDALAHYLAQGGR